MTHRRITYIRAWHALLSQRSDSLPRRSRPVQGLYRAYINTVSMQEVCCARMDGTYDIA